MTSAQQLTAPLAEHGEGPVWADRFYFVDMLAGDVVSLGDDGAVGRRHVGSVVAALRPRAGGGFVYAVERGFALVDADGGTVRTLPEVWSAPDVRMNDGGCDPQGRFYCGTMAYDARAGAGSLYRLDADHSVHTVLSGVTVSNGLCWDPTGALAYYVDSATGRVDVLDHDAVDGLSGRRPFATTPGATPDGLTVDAQGGVWVALWDGGAVHRYAPDGTLSTVVTVPVTHVTACTFGGPDLDLLYITTSRQGVAARDEPAAGAVFVVEAGVRGLPTRPFGG